MVKPQPGYVYDLSCKFRHKDGFKNRPVLIIRQVNEYQFAAVELTGTKPIEPPRDWDKAKEEIKKYTRPKLIKPTWAQCDNVFIVDTSVLTSFRGVMDSEDFGRVLAKIIECKGK